MSEREIVSLVGSVRAEAYALRQMPFRLEILLIDKHVDMLRSSELRRTTVLH